VTYECKVKKDWVKVKESALDKAGAQEILSVLSNQGEIRKEAIIPLYRKQASAA
jgi:hypothetical protein